MGISTPQQIPGKQPNGAPFFSGSSGVSPVRSCGDGCFTHFLWTFFMVVVHDILYLICIHLINTSILGIHPLFFKKHTSARASTKKNEIPPLSHLIVGSSRPSPLQQLPNTHNGNNRRSMLIDQTQISDSIQGGVRTKDIGRC